MVVLLLATAGSMMAISFAITIASIVCAILVTAVAVALAILFTIVMSIALVPVRGSVTGTAIVAVSIAAIVVSIAMATSVAIARTVATCVAILVAIGRSIARRLRLLLFALERLERTVDRVRVLTLLEKAGECRDVRRKRLVRLGVLLPMTEWDGEKNLLDLLLVAGQCHRATKQAVLEVRHQLYPAAHKVVNRHECGLFHGTEPADQLVSDIGEPRQCFEVVSDALKKVLVRLAFLGRASCRHDVAPLSECDFLQALFQKREKGRSILFFVCREAIDHLVLEIWEGHCQKELWAKAGLVRRNAGRVLLTVGSEGDFDAVRLLQPVFDGTVGHPIGTKRGPLVEPPKLGCSDGLEEIRHGWVWKGRKVGRVDCL